MGVDGQSHALAVLLSGKRPVSLLQEDEWTSELIWFDAENLSTHRDSIPWPSS